MTSAGQHRPSRRPRSRAASRQAIADAPVLRVTVLYLLIAAVAGALAGLVWHLASELPSYTIGTDGSASISERGLTSVFSADAVYSLIGLVLGLCLGVLAWRWYSRRGAMVVGLAAAGPLLSALTCWWVGLLLGPDNFATRVSSAKAGDTVQIDLALHTWTPVMVWVLAALLPVLVISLIRWDAPPSRR